MEDLIKVDQKDDKMIEYRLLNVFNQELTNEDVLNTLFQEVNVEK